MRVNWRRAVVRIAQPEATGEKVESVLAFKCKPYVNHKGYDQSQLNYPLTALEVAWILRPRDILMVMESPSAL